MKWFTNINSLKQECYLNNRLFKTSVLTTKKITRLHYKDELVDVV